MTEKSNIGDDPFVHSEWISVDEIDPNSEIIKQWLLQKDKHESDINFSLQQSIPQIPDDAIRDWMRSPWLDDA